MSVGYDPDRVRALTHRTRDAIEATRRLTSDDPAAAEAIRALAGLRRVLDDHWMPALLGVLRSDALTTWSTVLRGGRRLPRRTAAAPDPLSPAASPSSKFSGLDLTEFLETLERHDADLASSNPPTDDELDELGREVARRLHTDADTTEAIVSEAGALPIIGRLLAEVDAGTDILVAVLAAMTRPVGLVAAVDLARHQASFELVLHALLDDPTACLAALENDETLAALAVWHDLDADLVETLVRTGLYDAVAAEPTRLEQGYGVLRQLTALANGALDHADFHPALALGVAASMVGYIDTLAPAVRHEGDGRVLVVDQRHDGGRGLEVDLGSYDDLVDLFGALLRHPPAGAALGSVLGGYGHEYLELLGPSIVEPPGVEPVARIADLLADAARAEHVELVAEAAAVEARLRTLSGAVGFGAGVVMTAAGVGRVTRSISTRAISLAARHMTSSGRRELADHRLAERTYDLVVLGAIDLAARRDDVRRAAGLTSIPAATWRTAREQVADIGRRSDPAERSKRTTRLERWIGAEVPDLHRFLGRVRSAPGMDELTEARAAVGVD